MNVLKIADCIIFCLKLIIFLIFSTNYNECFVSWIQIGLLIFSHANLHCKAFVNESGMSRLLNDTVKLFSLFFIRFREKNNRNYMIWFRFEWKFNNNLNLLKIIWEYLTNQIENAKTRKQTLRKTMSNFVLSRQITSTTDRHRAALVDNERAACVLPCACFVRRLMSTLNSNDGRQQ